MRIGIIGQTLDNQYAGIYYFTKNLVQKLSDEHAEHEIHLLRSDKKRHFDFINITTTTIVTVNFAQRVKFVFRDVAKWARDHHLDIVIEPAHFGPFNLPPHIKRVTFIHDLTPFMYPKWQPLFSRLLQKLFLPRILKKADLVLTNSHFTKSEIIRRLTINEHQVKVAHLGVSPKFQPIVHYKKTINKYGIHKPYLLYQGTIEPRKNIGFLIKAFELYKTQYPKCEAQLILAGKVGWKARHIIKAKYDSIHNDDIILLGYVERQDMAALYSGSKAFIYPSLYEGFGLPVIEALACGTLVITSDTSSMPEVGGSHAFYFNPQDIRGLSTLILRACQGDISPSKRQIEYAQSFSWSNTAKTVIEAVATL